MKCRARAVAQTLNYVWVTDDILADAFNRFARVSHTSRRYGSNVPGPMEAHRRLARRRIGMTTNVTSVASPLSDFASWLGLGGPSQWQSPESRWSWEPPSIPKTLYTPLLDQSTPVLNKELSDTHESDLHDSTLDKTEDISADDHPSRLAFRKVLAECSLVEPASLDNTPRDDGIWDKFLSAVEEDDLGPALDFLRSSRDEPAAHNLRFLLLRLSNREVSDAALCAVGAVLGDKTKLGTLDPSMLSCILMTILGTPLAPRMVALIVDVLNGLSWPDRYLVVGSVTQNKDWDHHLLPIGGSRNLGSARSRNVNYKSLSADEPLTLWLECLRKCTWKRSHTESGTWFQIYCILSYRYRSESFWRHFGQLPLLDVATIILRHWVPKLRTTTVDKVDEGNFIRFIHPRQSQPHVSLQAFRDMQSARPETHPFINLLDVLAQHGAPFQRVSYQIFQILSLNRRTDEARELLDQITAAAVPYRDPALSHRNISPAPKTILEAIQNAVEEGSRANLEWAAGAFLGHPTVAVIDVPDLPPAMIRSGLTSPYWADRIFSMMMRYYSKDRYQRELKVEQEHAARVIKTGVARVVTNVAIEWAECPGISARVAFRRTWSCYRFLRDRHFRPGKRIVQALVTAGIRRFMDAGQRIPQTQLRYLLRLVERYLGFNQAILLDHQVYQIVNADPYSVGVVPDKAPKRYERKPWSKKAQRNFPPWVLASQRLLDDGTVSNRPTAVDRPATSGNGPSDLRTDIESSSSGKAREGSSKAPIDSTTERKLDQCTARFSPIVVSSTSAGVDPPKQARGDREPESKTDAQAGTKRALVDSTPRSTDLLLVNSWSTDGTPIRSDTGLGSRLPGDDTVGVELNDQSDRRRPERPHDWEDDDASAATDVRQDGMRVGATLQRPGSPDEAVQDKDDAESMAELQALVDETVHPPGELSASELWLSKIRYIKEKLAVEGSRGGAGPNEQGSPMFTRRQNMELGLRDRKRKQHTTTAEETQARSDGRKDALKGRMPPHGQTAPASDHGIDLLDWTESFDNR